MHALSWWSMSKLAPVICLLALPQGACGQVVSDACHDGADVLADGGFEAPATAWMSDPGHSWFCSSSVILPPTGNSSGCLGTTGAATETLTQVVALPAGAATVALSGSICIDTAETDTLLRDVLSIDLLDGESVIASLGMRSNRDGTRGCQFKPLQTASAPLASHPAMATLRLRATQDGPNMLTTFYLDDLKLTVGCTP
jgi:hypothetical protein